MNRLRWIATILVLGAPIATQAVDPLQPPTAHELATAATATTEPGWQAGPVEFHPRVTAGLTHDDNIELSQTNRLASFIGTVTPELAAVLGAAHEDAGAQLSLDYRPTVFLFTDHTNNDTVDQWANFTARWTGAKLLLALSQEYAQTHGAVMEIGQRVRQDSYKTDLLARYQLSDKTAIEVGPRLEILDSASFLDSRDAGLDAAMDYAFSPRFTAGVGGTVGYLRVERNPDQVYERAMARATYAVATKMTVAAGAGVEFRDYRSHRSTSARPVFGLSATYRPFQGTTLTLEGHRREETSILLDEQNYLTTGGTAEIRQFFWERYYLSVSGGYDHRTYTATEAGVAANRTDNYCSIRPAAGATIARNWKIEVFYLYQTSNSSAAFHSFVDHQAGFLGSWGF